MKYPVIYDHSFSFYTHQNHLLELPCAWSSYDRAGISHKVQDLGSTDHPTSKTRIQGFLGRQQVNMSRMHGASWERKGQELDLIPSWGWWFYYNFTNTLNICQKGGIEELICKKCSVIGGSVNVWSLRTGLGRSSRAASQSTLQWKPSRLAHLKGSSSSFIWGCFFPRGCLLPFVDFFP